MSLGGAIKTQIVPAKEKQVRYVPLLTFGPDKHL